MTPASPVHPGAPEVSIGAPPHAVTCASVGFPEEVGPCDCGAAEIIPLPAFRDGIHTISRWELDDVDRARIAAGGSVYLTVLNGSGPVFPALLTTESPIEVKG